MARRLDQILVIDVESTCWENAPPPPGQSSEIIEVGLCPVEVATARRLEKRSILVRPQRSGISPFCTQLTSLTPEMFADAGTLADAVRILRDEYHSGDRLWASWGDYDREQFQRVCREAAVDYPFGRSHLNLKTLFALVAGQPRELGLDRAYTHLGWTMEGRHHRGHDDAWNIASVLCELLKHAREGLMKQIR